jgi:metallo-beta-lactamase family protein
MGEKITKIYREFGAYNVSETSRVTFTTDVKLSKILKEGRNVIIAGAGMCDGGRIRGHLKRNLANPKNTVMFVGFQAKGSLGDYILKHPRKVWIDGELVKVKARIVKIDGMSAHADVVGLIDWYKGFEGQPAFICNHGEPESIEALTACLLEG